MEAAKSLVLNPGRRVFVIIGDPISQARSPDRFATLFKERGIDAAVVPMQVKAEHVASFLATIRQVGNVDGMIATIPHKQAVCDLANEWGPLAEATQAANVLKPIGDSGWAAEIFDGYGMIEAFKRRGIEVAGKNALIVGAGGAGSALAVALRKLTDVGRIRIADIDNQRAESLAERLDNAEAGSANPQGFDIVINATPVGMESEEMPFDSALLEKDSIVGDAVMKPLQTRLLKEAEAAGCTIVRGSEMLDGQLDPILEFWGLVSGEANVK